MIFVWFLIVKLFSSAEGYTGCDDLISIDDDQFSASSSFNDSLLPAKAKLDGSGAWCSLGGINDTERYLQIKFKKMTNVVKIVTQGRRDQYQWTAGYELKFSQDGITFGDILSTSGSTMYFYGNINDYSNVYNNLPFPVTMKYLRLYIASYWNQPCIRIGVYGCDALSYTVCNDLISIDDYQFSASSSLNDDFLPAKANLDGSGAWCSLDKNEDSRPYLEIDFKKMTNVVKVVTQGMHDQQQRSTLYTLKFSQDGYSFGDILSTNALSCSEYLVSGVDSVPDDKMTASSYYSSDYLPSYARIYTDTYWCPDSYDTSTAYFQVQFQRKKKVAGFLTRGPSDDNSFIVLFSISYSNDGGNTWQNVKKDDGKTRIFFGNKNKNSTMLNMLDTPIEVEMIRFNTVKMYDYPCGSFEVFGCNSVPEVRTGFHGHYIPLKVDLTLTPHLVWTKNGTMFDCIKHCSDDCKCSSFAFNKNDQVCKGFSVKYYRDDDQSPDFSNDMYYIDRYWLDKYGYTLSISSALFYKIITSVATHADAKKICQDQTTNLLPIRLHKYLQEIQSIIARNSYVINAGIHVDGTLVSSSTTWQYHDNTTVNDALWSASGKNSANGHCTSVTKDGLVATDCDSKLFFACGL